MVSLVRFALDGQAPSFVHWLPLRIDKFLWRLVVSFHHTDSGLIWLLGSVSCGTQSVHCPLVRKEPREVIAKRVTNELLWNHCGNLMGNQSSFIEFSFISRMTAIHVQKQPAYVDSGILVVLSSRSVVATAEASKQVPLDTGPIVNDYIKICFHYGYKGMWPNIAVFLMSSATFHMPKLFEKDWPGYP